MPIRRLSFVLALALPVSFGAVATAQEPPTPPADESALGPVIDVTLHAEDGFGGPPPPKIGLVPLISQGSDDALAQLVVRNDVNLSGQYQVIEDSDAPPGPYTRNTILDLLPWRKKDCDYLLRVYVNAKVGSEELVGEVYETPSKDDVANAEKNHTDAPPTTPPKPLSVVKIDTRPPEAPRTGMHRLVDQLLFKLTGIRGSFASQMVYTARVGRWRQVFVVDSDGFNLHPYGPSNGTSMSPHFGPYGEVYYAISEDFHRYKVVYGPKGTPTGVEAPGSIMSFAFSPDAQKIAYDIFENGDSKVFMRTAADQTPRLASAAPLANHPVFGPNDLFAYLGGKYAQRVYVNGKPISPPGFWSSAPVFCDTPAGPKVIYTVGVGAGSDLIVQNPDGSGIHRLTKGMGANQYSACSPDGRLVAFFSSQGAPGKGPGLYIAPVQRPWLAKKISAERGESLDWAMITATGPR